MPYEKSTEKDFIKRAASSEVAFLMSTSKEVTRDVDKKPETGRKKQKIGFSQLHNDDIYVLQIFTILMGCFWYIWIAICAV